MRLTILTLAAATAFLWFIAVTEDHNQWIIDNTCPPRTPVIRYPAHLDGPHPAVCNPTGVNWR